MSEPEPKPNVAGLKEELLAIIAGEKPCVPHDTLAKRYHMSYSYVRKVICKLTKRQQATLRRRRLKPKKKKKAAKGRRRLPLTKRIIRRAIRMLDQGKCPSPSMEAIHFKTSAQYVSSTYYRRLPDEYKNKLANLQPRPWRRVP